jgi:hypothetical protein
MHFEDRPALAVRARALATETRGTILVIAIFMSACLVGCVWYMYGLGEAMVYRQQLRAAADATAFDSAVVHAVGMNVVAMTNIVMACVLSILLLLQILLLIGIAATIIAAIAEVPTLGGDTPVTAGFFEFSEGVFDVIEEVQDPIFGIIAALNVTAAVESVLFPWAGVMVAHDVPESHYGKAALDGDGVQPFSFALIPTRIPFGSPWAEQVIGDKFGEWLASKSPILRKLFAKTDKGGLGLGAPNPAKFLSSVSRYGLPTTEDNFSTLCAHSAHELVDEFVYLNPFGAVFATVVDRFPPAKAFLNGFEWFFGIAVGAEPGIFCSGVDPQFALQNEFGASIGAIKGILNNPVVPGPAKTALKKFTGFVDKALRKSPKSWKSVALPMKTFTLYANGNMFGQIWATIGGDNTLTTGAISGVEVASWGASSDQPTDATGETIDYAEAEFYYDCGAEQAAANPFPSSSPLGAACTKDNLWNMNWKARLRRWTPASFPWLKALENAVWSASGIDGFVDKALELLPGPIGRGAKYTLKQAMAMIKACATSVGQGSTPTLQLGKCPVTLGELPGKGSVTETETAPDGTPVSQVYH